MQQLSNTAVTGSYKKPKDEEEATALMAILRTRSENKKCFDCPASTPEWCSIPFGIFLCLECCGRHRGMGVHISFMKSATMDAWRPDEAYRMSKGGNGSAAEYFRQHGLNEAKNRYTSMAASMYKKRLDKLVAESGGGDSMIRAGSDPELARQASSGSPNTPIAVTSGFVSSSPVGDKPTSGSTILSFNNSNNGTTNSGISSPTSNNNTTTPIAISTTKVSLIGKKPTATGKTALAKKKGLGLGGLGVQKVDKLEEASGVAVPKTLIGGEDETSESTTTTTATSTGIRGSNDAPKRVKTLGGGTSSFTTTTTSGSNNASSSSYGNNLGMGGGGGGPAPVVYRTGNYSGGGPDYGGIGSSPANEDGGGGGDGFRDVMFGIGQSLQSLKRKADAAANAAAQMLDES